jgi:hypothetical protein
VSGNDGSNKFEEIVDDPWKAKPIKASKRFFLKGLDKFYVVNANDGGMADGGSVNDCGVNQGSRNGGSVADTSVNDSCVDSGSMNGGSVNGGSVNGGSMNDGNAHGKRLNGGSVNGRSVYGESANGSSARVDGGSARVGDGSVNDGSVNSSSDRDKEEGTDYSGMDEVLNKFLVNFTAKKLDDNGDLKPGCHWLDLNTIPYDAIVCAFVRDNKQGFEDKSRSGSDATCRYIRVRKQASDKDEVAAVTVATQVKEAVDSNVNDDDESYEVEVAKEVEAAVKCGASVWQKKWHDPFIFSPPVVKPAQVK